jgi:alkylation response protein AidB-like acyl-CoA dehydrogenase
MLNLGGEFMQAKGNFFGDNDDIMFHVTKRVDAKELYELTTDEEKEALSLTSPEDYAKTWMDICSSIGEYAGSTLVTNQDKVAKAHLTLDDNKEVVFPPELQENISTFIELGGPGLGIPPKFGGIGGTALTVLLIQELLARACPSTQLNLCWYSSIADIIHQFGTDELKETYIPMIAAGEFSGSMALTEPDAGSDLANIRSYAEPQPDGSWKVYGTKQFISNGNGKVSLVLAKNKKGGKTLQDINLYVVPRILDGRQNFNIAKLEEKPGLHGSATCALEFNGSIGYLLGKDGEGFGYMLRLMNEARVAVGFQAMGVMESSLRLAKEFASQRKAFGKTIDRHELIAEKLLDMEVDLRALRSLSYQAAYYLSLESLTHEKLRQPGLSSGEAAKLKKKLKYLTSKIRSWTPLIKWWGGERSFSIARDALQIHGGYGFTTEYKPEWWLRESLILSIYEGTSQIQALMCMKDTLKEIVKKPNEFVESVVGIHLKTFSEKDPLKKTLYKMMRKTNSALTIVMRQLIKENLRSQYNTSKPDDIFQLIKVLGKGMTNFDNLSPAITQAERITEMKAIIAMARALMWDVKEDPSRRWIAEHFISRYYPVILKNWKEIESPSTVLQQRLAQDGAQT